MFKLSGRSAAIFVIILAVAMAITRGHHFATLTHLPDASWAIFFLLGFYFRNYLLFPLFLALAALMDCLAVTQFGVSNYCLTPAYPFLIPAYLALWLAGRWLAAHCRFDLRSLLLAALSVSGGAAVCELVSSGSFYFLGGRYDNTSLPGFAQMLVQYFPSDLGNVTLYVGIATAIHALVNTFHRPAATA
jgi:hypothetical protein